MAENPMTDKEFARLRQFIRPYSRLNGFLYKLSGGRVMGTLQGRPVMLVTMKGVKSGKQQSEEFACFTVVSPPASHFLPLYYFS